MPNLTLNGKNVQVDQNTAQRISNLVQKPDLSKILDEYWTAEKLGKHKELKKDHGDILMKTLLVDPEEFKKDLFENHLKLGNFSSQISKILSATKLNGDLRPEYLSMCLGVTTERPAIGKGEFLFAASFNNIGFASDSGDLIDVDTKQKIEVKGISAVLGNGQNRMFKQMSETLMRSVAKRLELDGIHRWQLDEDNAMKIKEKIGLDRNKAVQTLTMLQNVFQENEAVARQAADVYFKEGQLIRTVAAMHLLLYMHREKSDYLLIINDDRFTMVKRPSDMIEAYEIIQKLTIKPWREGEYGIKVTLR